jgi:hypothetical protein
MGVGTAAAGIACKLGIKGSCIASAVKGLFSCCSGTTTTPTTSTDATNAANSMLNTNYGSSTLPSINCYAAPTSVNTFGQKRGGLIQASNIGCQSSRYRGGLPAKRG